MAWSGREKGGECTLVMSSETCDFGWEWRTEEEGGID